MSDTLVWIIIAAFYAPLHFLGPVGVIFLTESGALKRRRLIKLAVIESAVTMVLAFTLAIWLAGQRMGLAMAIMFFSMLLPYVLLWWHRRLSS